MPIITKKTKIMKKILFGIAIVLGMVIATSCVNQKKDAAVEAEAVEAVDSLTVAADSLAVEALDEVAE